MENLNKNIDYKSLYYALFADVSDLIEEQEHKLAALKAVQLRAEERFLAMGDDSAQA